MINKLVVLLVAAGMSMTLCAMPTAEEQEKVRPLVQGLMKPDLDAMKLGKKSRSDVAKSAMDLYSKADSPAAKMLLARNALNLYAKAGEYEAAESALDALLAAVPDYPAVDIAELLEKTLHPIPNRAAPNLRARLAAVKDKAQAASQLKKLLSIYDTLAEGPKRKACAARIASAYVALDDWPNANKYFAVSDSPAAAAASAELKLQDEPEASRPYDKPADAWWSVELPKKDAKLSAAIRSHAAALYAKSLPSLKGLAKVQAERRIAEVESAAEVETSTAVAPKKTGGLKLYDEELDYLESDGGQWIETGVGLSLKGRYAVEIKVSYMPGAAEMDFWGNFGSDNPILVGLFGGFVFGYNKGAPRIDGKPEKDFVTHVIKLEINGAKRSLFVDGSCIGTAAYVHSGAPLSLFSGGKSYKCARARIHYFKILKDGKSLLEMLPVKKGDLVYMYDKVSKKMFTSTGAGKLMAPQR